MGIRVGVSSRGRAHVSGGGPIGTSIMLIFLMMYWMLKLTIIVSWYLMVITVKVSVVAGRSASRTFRAAQNRHAGRPTDTSMRDELREELQRATQQMRRMSTTPWVAGPIRSRRTRS